MKHTLYLECTHGISGDMTAAALLDLGASRHVLEQALNSLPLEGFAFKISTVQKAGLRACDFEVVLAQENHDHNMEYLHGSTVQKTETIPEHSHAGHTHHAHRHLSDIYTILDQACMTDTAKKTARRIFEILGRAEAKAHGTSLEEVHFHEVGAADSIADIAAVAVCLDNLQISDVIIPALHEGCGTIRCQHGILPVPVPATANIITEHHIPLKLTGIQGEFVTPTGAAIATAIRTSGQLPEQFQITRIGIGAGKRTYERPSILRAMLIETPEPDSSLSEDAIYKLETNIDDCTGEAMGYVLERLMNAGAKDVHYFPVFMKKNRPAYQLNVLCQEADIPKLEQLIFSQTTTIGIRRQRMARSILPRSIQDFQTEYGLAQAKICETSSGTRIYPEYESVARICRETGASYDEIHRKLQAICCRQLSGTAGNFAQESNGSYRE